MSIPAGMSLLDLWRQFVGMGYESEMTPDLRLRFWKDRSRDFSGSVIFRAGKHIRGEVTRDAQDAGLRTRMLVQGDGGRFFEVTDPVLEGDPYIGRREGYLSFTASTDPTTLQRVGDNALAEVSLASDALSVPLHHGIGNGDFEPFAEYRNGDWVSLDIPGTYTLEKVRVRSLSVRAVAGGDYEVDADFNSVSLENIVRLKRIVDALGGGGSASGVVASTGGSLSSSGGPSSGSTGRVGAEQGDTPGYLYDKIATGAGIATTLSGSPGARQLVIALGTIPDISLGSGTPSATNFLRGDRSWAPPSGLAALARKVADESTSATVFADSTGLSLALAASTAYRFRFVVFFTTNATTVGIKLGLNGPAGATLRWALLNPTAAPAQSTAMINATGTAYDTEALAATAGPGATGGMAIVEGVIVTSGTPGTLRLRHASETATATTILANSYGELVAF